MAICSDVAEYLQLVFKQVIPPRQQAMEINLSVYQRQELPHGSVSGTLSSAQRSFYRKKRLCRPCFFTTQQKMYSWLWELYAVISFLVFLWVNEERCSLPVQRATSDKPRNWVRGAVVFTCCGGQAVCTHAGLFPIEIWVGITQEHSSALRHHQAQPQHKENGSSERPAWPRLLQNLLEPGSPGGECQL